jgi:hypothetical protein
MGIDGYAAIIISVVAVSLTTLFTALGYWSFQKKRLEFEERRRMIENGITPPVPAAPPLTGWPGVRQQELQLKFAERRLLIEKGMPVHDACAKPPTRQEYLRRGIIWTCAGVGILIAYVVLALALPRSEVEDARTWCLGLGPLALLYGIGNLIYQRWVPDAPDAGARENVPAQEGSR